MLEMPVTAHHRLLAIGFVILYGAGFVGARLGIAIAGLGVMRVMRNTS